MGFEVVLFLFVAAYVADFSWSSKVDITYPPKVHHSHRRSLGSDLKKLMGALEQENLPSPKQQVNNFTELVMNFVNTSYKCGSEEAQKVVPQIITMIKGIFQIPFVDYIVDEASQQDVLKALEECASKKTKRLRKRKQKKRHRNKIDETEWRAFFTGAFENAEPKESEHGSVNGRKTNRTMEMNFKSILDEIIKAESMKSHERSKDALLRIILEIDDYLRREKNRYKEDARFKSVSNRKGDSAKVLEEANDSVSNRDSKKEVEESIGIKLNRDTMKDVDEANDSRANRNSRKDIEESNESKSDKGMKRYLQEVNGSAFASRELRADSGAVELKTSDEVVLDQNMEITVRMDGNKGK